MISVAVPTHNRVAPLEESLRDLIRQNREGLPEVELLVILNNSPAETREVVQRCLAGFPGIARAVEEPTPGLSHARNRAIQEFQGDILIYTDDDVVRDPGWLRAMVRCFDDPTVGCVGGRIIPRLACPLPHWFDRPYYNGVIVKYDLGDEPLVLTEQDSMPYGANMAFRREVVEKVGAFRSDLDLLPGTRLCGGETEYLHRAAQSGFRVLYCPSAITYHPIGEERLSRAYVREWFHDFAVSWVRMNYAREKTFPRLAGVPRHLFRRVFDDAFGWCKALLTFKTSDRIFHATEFLYHITYAVEFRRLNGDQEKPDDDGSTEP